MFRGVLGALTGNRGQVTLTQEEKVRRVLKQAHDFEIALKAMDYVLDDRADEGLSLLANGESDIEKRLGGDESAEVNPNDKTIGVLAKGVIEFLEATLGFEAEEMKKASATLAEAENLSLKSRQFAQKMDLRSSSIYPPGTVYAVTYTESCLLHALLMIFSESVLEGAKALLKLRKAYYMLQEIFQAIKKAEKLQKSADKPSRSRLGSLRAKHNSSSSARASAAGTGSPRVKSGSVSSARSSASYKNATNDSDASFISGTSHFTSSDIPYELNENEKVDHDLLEFAEEVHKMRIKRLTGAHIGNSPAINRLRTDLGLDSSKVLPEGKESEAYDTLTELDLSQATIDEFIHSGVNLCYGILQVVLSLLPSNIGAVLSIVGFRGSREDGLRLVWRSTKQRNIHGCIGLLGLMFYYDGPFQFTDDDFDIPVAKESTSLMKTETNSTIRSESDMDGPTLLHPGKILENALLQSRALFPNSALWLLNESTMLAGKGRLYDAVTLMDSIDADQIRMRQVKSLMIFNRAILLVHLHEYERAATDLLSLINISGWSHALYYYFAGCCYLEIYRMHQMGIKEVEDAAKFKNLAYKYIFDSPIKDGKGFKSKPLPLDKFMMRKVSQFEATKLRLNLEDPLDAIGTSPVRELQYFYNGYNRMTKEHLGITYKMLTEYHNPAVDEHNEDQELIKNLLVSLTLRRLGNVEEGFTILDKAVIPHFFSVINGKTKYVKKTEDPWLYPTALYERALFTWKLKEMDGLKEAREWLLRAQGYADDYELSSRVEMKIKAALDRVEHSL
ncbi:hypothetical protein TPHA_0I01010 [Tetrapisispora phaffii CBS 4417]|uniref:Inclusion body clearance protein IML2 n=1 Tax=Tetrapisispora phaffii (strain ATCC 24235 / CBS 4417 / NBRC 1672 / NRRL Y-8282 / UCD 70-5) TaxID=1071381 RepID=G8BXH9_TETPH|nr:hypothetical protein TPHA_0I01010 [Tetrapisispora phaffii CBS 4417]CCE64607.1 hypothetical protein TPHA_0I01010 [Tetrapisispora phaffii CBS 4417]